MTTTTGVAIGPMRSITRALTGAANSAIASGADR